MSLIQNRYRWDYDSKEFNEAVMMGRDSLCRMEFFKFSDEAIKTGIKSFQESFSTIVLNFSDNPRFDFMLIAIAQIIYQLEKFLKSKECSFNALTLSR